MVERNNEKMVFNMIVSILSVGAVALTLFLIAHFCGGTLNIGNILPSEWPPMYVFYIVWSVIFAMLIGIIYCLMEKEKMDKFAAGYFIANGLLIMLWAVIYFVAKSPIGGLVIMAMLLAFSVALNAKMFKVNCWYGLATMSYPIWVLLMLIFNNAMWIMS